jgi:hypothetical protein
MVTLLSSKDSNYLKILHFGVSKRVKPIARMHFSAEEGYCADVPILTKRRTKDDDTA